MADAADIGAQLARMGERLERALRQLREERYRLSAMRASLDRALSRLDEERSRTVYTDDAVLPVPYIDNILAVDKDGHTDILVGISYKEDSIVVQSGIDHEHTKAAVEHWARWCFGSDDPLLYVPPFRPRAEIIKMDGMAEDVRDG